MAAFDRNPCEGKRLATTGIAPPRPNALRAHIPLLLSLVIDALAAKMQATLAYRPSLLGAVRLDFA